MTKKIVIHRHKPLLISKSIKDETVEVDIEVPKWVYVMTNYWFWVLSIPFTVFEGLAIFFVLKENFIAMFSMMAICAITETVLGILCSKAIDKWNKLFF